MRFFESKIDKLVRRNAKLALNRQKVEDNKNEVNSEIETEIRKLENLAQRKNQDAQVKIEAIEREIEKNKQLIKVEKEYYSNITLEKK